MSLTSPPPDSAVAERLTSALRPPSSVLKWALLLLPSGYLWFRLINNLRVEWETNPQYSYGYIVPFLCIGLLFQRWQTAQPYREPATELRPIVHPRSAILVGFALLAFLYLPTRLIELAVPEWRPIQWSLGFITIGLTLTAIYFGAGWSWFRRYLFPLGFFLVAIPWPTLIEQPLIQTLTRFNAALVIEVMGIFGIPAVQHGNVIEVGTGVVGIDEACSGIRSFQSSLMISLFLGALYDLTFWRRVLFVPIGFLLAMLFNLGRTSFLTWVAAKQGVASIEKYHDPAGLWILIGCTAGLWLVGLLMRNKKKQTDIEEATGKDKASDYGLRTTINFQLSTINRLSLSLLVWLVFVEVGSQAWYRSREARLITGPDWSVRFPEANPTFRELPMAPATLNLLRFDDGKQAAWTEADGTRWSAFYFNWNPGRVAGYLAKRHTPEICMPATGLEMRSGPELMVLDIHGLQLPVRRYVFGSSSTSYHVYHCRWEAGATTTAFVEQESARLNLVRSIWAGRGNKGQKIVEIIIGGMDDPELAKAALVLQLEKMIKIEGTETERARSDGAQSLEMRTPPPELR